MKHARVSVKYVQHVENIMIISRLNNPFDLEERLNKHVNLVVALMGRMAYLQVVDLPRDHREQHHGLQY